MLKTYRFGGSRGRRPGRRSKGSTAGRSRPESNTELKFDSTRAEPKYLPRLLVCEGYEDSLFFQLLIEAFKLPRFYIEIAGGKNKIGAALSKVRLERTKVWVNLRDIVIVGDNDDSPSARFNDICKQISDVFGGEVAPSAPLMASKTKPRCTVLMVPWTDQEGNLECLCCDAAREADKEVGASVDTFLDLVHSNLWESKSRSGKAWLRANLAARCSDPFVALGDVFHESRNRRLIPITVRDGSFKRIAEVLATF